MRNLRLRIRHWKMLAASMMSLLASGEGYTLAPPLPRTSSRGATEAPSTRPSATSKRFFSTTLSVTSLSHSTTTRLHAVTVATSPQEHSIMASPEKRRKWHRRFFLRIPIRDRKLRMQATAAAAATIALEQQQQQQQAAAAIRTRHHHEKHVINGGNATEYFVSQEMHLLEQPPVVVNLSPQVVADLETALENDDDKMSRLARVTGGITENALFSLMDRWSNGVHENMRVKCQPSNSVLDLVKGRFQCDATIDVDRIQFQNLQLSGGRVESQRLALNLYSFAGPLSGRVPRFPNQFDLLGHNLTLTENDIYQSSCIRNGLRTLLIRILRNRGVSPSLVQIDSIHILPSGKVACQGHAVAHVLGTVIDFEVRTGLGLASRGHVLTFPGLKISLSPAMGLFVPVLPEVNLDLGHNAQIYDLQLDGEKASLHLSCRATITPRHTLRLRAYHQDKDAYSAKHMVDVGKWLTRVGNFYN